MDNLGIDEKHSFGIHASVIFQLGESLISDSVQAIVELIKNSYDADASYAVVTIETSKPNDVLNSRYKGARGFIKIEDDGHGMDLTTIQEGWLTISNSLKRKMKESDDEAKRKTRKGRTPLGDKGLGRLGSQRLGHNLEIFTKPENEDVEYHVAFSWQEFETKDKLNDVDIYIAKTVNPGRKSGTTLLISGLKEPELLKPKEPESSKREEKLAPNLITALSNMISPYNVIEGFSIKVNIDGNALKLESFLINVLKASQLHYEIDFNGEIFTVKGKARLNFIRPQGKKEQKLFRVLVEEDCGEEFFKFLSTNSPTKAEKYNLNKSNAEGWFVEYELEKKIKDFDALELDKDGNIMSPGKFSGKVDSFDLRNDETYYKGIFNRYSQYKEYLKNFSGIKVYRDGFGIRVDKDWLGLGKQWTSGLSYYGLKLENTLGYIALSAADNTELKETTDREGFKVTPHYNNFFEMLQIFKKFTGEVQEFLRRGWLEFLSKHHEEEAEIVSGTSPEEISKKIRNSLSEASAYHTKTEDLKLLLTQKVFESHQSISNIASRLSPEIDNFIDLKNSINSLKEHIETANRIVSDIEKYLREVSGLEAVQKVLEDQIANLRDQLEQLFDVASLGLTAESLSHEIHNITDRLSKYTQEIGHYLKMQKSDPRILTFVEHVKTTISALRKQMSYLAPSLQYVREKKEKIDIYTFCREVAFYHRERGSLKDNDITVQVTPRNAENFYVYMNRGKLIQVLDNLFFNSGYWLREDIRTGRRRDGRIHITIDKPFLRFEDNGRGIDPSVETTLFEPFITTKGKGKGRGLGLFIVQQLLDSEGCTISLLPNRNMDNRLFIFEIDFTGGLDDGESN